MLAPPLMARAGALMNLHPIMQRSAAVGNCKPRMALMKGFPLKLQTTDGPNNGAVPDVQQKKRLNATHDAESIQ